MKRFILKALTFLVVFVSALLIISKIKQLSGLKNADDFYRLHFCFDQFLNPKTTLIVAQVGAKVPRACSQIVPYRQTAYRLFA